jgi:hypothetical protein
MLGSNRQTEQHCWSRRRHHDEYRNGSIPPVSQDHWLAAKSGLIKPTGATDGMKALWILVARQGDFDRLRRGRKW